MDFILGTNSQWLSGASDCGDAGADIVAEFGRTRKAGASCGVAGDLTQAGWWCRPPRFGCRSSLAKVQLAATSIAAGSAIDSSFVRSPVDMFKAQT